MNRRLSRRRRVQEEIQNIPQWTQNDLHRLYEKWGKLVQGELAIKDKDVRENTMKILDTTDRFFNSQSGRKMIQEAGFGSVGTGGFPVGDTDISGIERYKQIVLPMLRRIFPALITNELVAVQPMAGPVGLAYALRFHYGTTADGATAGNEIGAPSTAPVSGYSGPYWTYEAERLGESATEIAGASGAQMNDLTVTVQSSVIYAKSRKLRALWTLETDQDLETMHNLSVGDQIADALQYEIGAEIDREVLYYLKQLAQAGGAYTWTYTTGGGPGADGRWEQEIYRTFYTKLLAASNDIARSTRRGAGNWVIASPRVCAMLESMSEFVSSVVDEDINTAQVGVSKVGRCGRFTVYRDMYENTNDYAIVGYKGAGGADSGLVFCPYVPIMLSRATSQDSFNPRMGVMSRYALATNLFGAENYYRYISVDLGGSMGTWTTTGGSTTVPYVSSGSNITEGSTAIG